LVLWVVASVSLGAVPLTSAAELLVVGAELSGWVVASLAAEVPSEWADELALEARLDLRVVAGSVAESVGGRWADVVVEAHEAGSIDASSFTAEVHSLSLAVGVRVAGLAHHRRDEQ